MELVAAKADLDPDALRRFYDLFGRTERVVTLYSQGVNQSASGTDKVNAILNCHLATGRIGRAGMGPFSLTGQPNAMGGREVGGLANQLAAHMGFTPEDIDRVRRFWDAPRIAARPGCKAVDLFDAVADGRVKAVWIAATNPADSMPRAGRVREALAKCPLVIVSDAWPTDTTALADIVLPAASWAEKDGTVTNSERRISRQRAFRASPGAARPDWWMFAQVARRMGWGKAFPYARPAEIFREHAALTAFENDGRRMLDLGALADLDDAAYDALAPLQWPCPKPGRGCDGPRLFARGGFPTADRRAHMLPLTPRADDRRADYPLTLNTGRVRDQWHTMTRTGRVPQLMTHVAEPRLALHPRDAARRGIADGGLARVESAHGEAVLRVALDPAMRPADAFAPMHWTDQFASSGPVGRLVHALVDPLSGQPDLKGTKVQVAAVAETWRGVLLRRRDGAPALRGGACWSKAPIAAGFAFALSGWAPLAAQIGSEQDLRRLLEAPAGAELLSYCDPKKSVFRYAGVVDGRLEACVFFASPGAAIPEADRARGLLGRRLEPRVRLALLAGLEAAAGPQRMARRRRLFGRAAAIGDVTRAGSLTGALAGLTILVPESRELDLFAAMLEAQGAVAVRCPLVQILDLEDTTQAEAWIERLIAGAFQDVVWLTGEGLRRLIAIAERGGRRAALVAALARVRAIARGPKPVRALRELGLAPGLAATTPTSQGVLDALAGEDIGGRAIGVQLYPGGGAAALLAGLRARGAAAFPVTPYRYASQTETGRVVEAIGRLAAGGIDMVAFTSSAQVDRLVAVAREARLEAALSAAFARIRIAAVGPVVEETLRRHGVADIVRPPGSFHLKPLVRAIAAAWTAR